MPVDSLAIDDAVPQTTADIAQSEQATDELSGGGIDVSSEGQQSPDDMLGGSDSVEETEDPAAENEEVDVSAEEVEAAPEVTGKRASERIQKLNTRAKEAEAKVAELNAQHQQQIAYVQYQMQQQMAEQQRAMQQQMDFYRAQEQAAIKRQQWEDEAKLSPAQKVEKEWLQRAKAAAKDELSPEIEAMKKQLQEERSMRERAFKAAQERQMLNQYKGRADLVNRNVVFKDFEDKDVTALNGKAQELLLTWGTAAGEEPEVAAQGFKTFLNDYFQARMRAEAKRAGPKLKQSQVAPKVAMQGVPKMSGPKMAPGKTFKFDTVSGKWGNF